MDHWTQKYFGDLYHEIYSRHLLDPERALDEAAFAAQVLDLGRRTVLDVACGYGRHARLLAASNRVVALDNNQHYLSEVRHDLNDRTANNLLPVQGDMRKIPLSDKAVDAVIMLFNSFGYFDDKKSSAPDGDAPAGSQRQVWKLPSVFYERKLVNENFGRFRDPIKDDTNTGEKGSSALDEADELPPEMENLGVLQEILRVLKPGGGFLLEIPNKAALMEAVEENPRRLMVMENCEVHEQFQWDEKSSRLVNRTRFVCDDREESVEYSLRLFEPSEIRAMMTDAGFRVRRTFGDYGGGRFGTRKSDVLLVHATRPAR